MCSFKDSKRKALSFITTLIVTAGSIMFSVAIGQLASKGTVLVDMWSLIILALIMSAIFTSGLKMFFYCVFNGFLVGIWCSNFLLWKYYPKVNMHPGIVLSNCIIAGIVIGLLAEALSMIKLDRNKNNPL